MAISEQQLETWSHQGAITSSSNTYNAIKDVLEASTTHYAGKDFVVFLQGSYGNSTNIYAESDVDLVIRLDSAFYEDISELSEIEKAEYSKSYPPASYNIVEFRRDVLSTLIAAYGTDVSQGKKSIAIAARNSRRKADVIVAAQYRRYLRFKDLYDESHVTGICFWTTDGRKIVNYPIQHRENLTRRHQASDQQLKPLIRICKNLRSRLVNDGYLADGVAPSYFIEGLLYNAPNSRFSWNYQETFENVFNWYSELSQKEKDDLVCANEQYYLLRNEFDNCWPTADADAFVEAVKIYYNNS